MKSIKKSLLIAVFLGFSINSLEAGWCDWLNIPITKFAPQLLTESPKYIKEEEDKAYISLSVMQLYWEICNRPAAIVHADLQIDTLISGSVDVIKLVATINRDRHAMHKFFGLPL